MSEKSFNTHSSAYFQDVSNNSEENNSDTEESTNYDTEESTDDENCNQMESKKKINKLNQKPKVVKSSNRSKTISKNKKCTDYLIEGLYEFSKTLESKSDKNKSLDKHKKASKINHTFGANSTKTVKKSTSSSTKLKRKMNTLTLDQDIDSEEENPKRKLKLNREDILNNENLNLNEISKEDINRILTSGQKENLYIMLNKIKKETKRHVFFNCSDPGDGKTYVTLSLKILGNYDYLIVFCPTHVKVHWFEKAKDFGVTLKVFPYDIIDDDSRDPISFLDRVTNGKKKQFCTNDVFDTLVQDNKVLFVFDEYHNIISKGKKSEFVRAINLELRSKLMRDSNMNSRSLFLSGTPLSETDDFSKLLFKFTAINTENYVVRALRKKFNGNGLLSIHDYFNQTTLSDYINDIELFIIENQLETEFKIHCIMTIFKDKLSNVLLCDPQLLENEENSDENYNNDSNDEIQKNPSENQRDAILEFIQNFSFGNDIIHVFLNKFTSEIPLFDSAFHCYLYLFATFPFALGSEHYFIKEQKNIKQMENTVYNFFEKYCSNYLVEEDYLKTKKIYDLWILFLYNKLINEDGTKISMRNNRAQINREVIFIASERDRQCENFQKILAKYKKWLELDLTPSEEEFYSKCPETRYRKVRGKKNDTEEILQRRSIRVDRELARDLAEYDTLLLYPMVKHAIKSLEQDDNKKIVIVCALSKSMIQLKKHIEELQISKKCIELNFTKSTKFETRKQKLDAFMNDKNIKIAFAPISSIMDGIDLDDKKGDCPRECYCSPFSAVITVYIQLIGRFRREGTKSALLFKFFQIEKAATLPLFNFALDEFLKLCKDQPTKELFDLSNFLMKRIEDEDHSSFTNVIMESNGLIHNNENQRISDMSELMVDSNMTSNESKEDLDDNKNNSYEENDMRIQNKDLKDINTFDELLSLEL